MSAPASSSSTAAAAASGKREREGPDEDPAAEPTDLEDFVELSKVDENPKFTMANGKHKKKVFGVFTEKGGVGKTNFILSVVRSGIFNRLLIIDTDPQNNVVNGFMSPTIVRKNVNRFETCSDFINTQKDPEKVRFKCHTGANLTNVEIVLGSSFTTKQNNLFEMERENDMAHYAGRVRASIRKELENVDAVFIDFNPKMALINKILLMACDEVVELVTGDIHSQSAMTRLMQMRDDECKKLSALEGANWRRFNITVVPSLIDRSRRSLRVGHKAFVEKIFDHVKEKYTADPECGIFFRGFVARAKPVFGVRPVKVIQMSKMPGSAMETKVMVNDVARVVMHCLDDTSETMYKYDQLFPWHVATTMEESSKLAKENPALYLFQSVKDKGLFKFGLSRTPTKRRKGVKATFKGDFKFVQAWHSTKAVVYDLEQKLLDYFSTSSDVGESFRLRKGDARTIIFEDLVAQLGDRSFIESLLLES